MTAETTTTTTDEIDEMHELTAELIERSPTLLDYADLIIKAIAALALLLIAIRLPL